MHTICTRVKISALKVLFCNQVCEVELFVLRGDFLKLEEKKKSYFQVEEILMPSIRSRTFQRIGRRVMSSQSVRSESRHLLSSLFRTKAAKK